MDIIRTILIFNTKYNKYKNHFYEPLRILGLRMMALQNKILPSMAS